MKKTLIAAGSLVVVAVLFLQAGQPPTTGPATEKRFPPLKVPPGFKATLFACDPLIEYPSVIAIGPKPGAIFVAVDYMTGLGTDGKVKSEVRLVEDTDGDGYADKATVFATGFNSIQGIAYHDGTVYVMHAPFLTALREKAQGQPSLGFAERKDLLSGLGLTPEQNPVRLHCANGVTIGHDGWLYLSMGDNGVNVPRPEGDRLVHNGGCILRCRPDGRDLHIFSTGLRNIYDVALDAELNVFTRDNENDGGTYMIRVCHCFHGSDHGYPYLYEDRKDELMTPIGDFGRGSSAGGVCYLETQFPPEYRGNLFFAEWGKSIVRYELKRQGSGFAPVNEIEFARGADKDTYPFKPTDVVVQRDGTLMVSDYADGQRPKRGHGRIYHIAYVGNGGKPAKTNDSPKLDSESHYERWEAQAPLERGNWESSTKAAKRSSLAKMHMIWALAHIQRANPKNVLIRDGILNIVRDDPDASVRAQAIRAIADLADPVLVKHKLDAGRGDAKLAKRLADLAKGQDPRVKFEIVIALGRLRWADAPDWLAKNLSKPDAAMAHAVQQTLRRADNWPAVVKLLDQPEPIRSIARRAVTDQYEATVVDGLIGRLDTAKEASHRRESADALTRIYKQPAPWKYWGYRPGPKPPNTEAWEKTEEIAAALNRMLADPDRDVRFAVLKRMQREKVPVQPVTLSKWLDGETDPAAAALILTALKEHPPADVRASLKAVVVNRKHSPENRTAALGMLLGEKNADALGILAGHAKALEDGPVLAHVLRRLAIQAWQNDEYARIIEPRLKSSAGEVRAAAMWGLGHMSNTRALPSLVACLEDKDVRVRRAAASAAYLARDDKQAIKLLVKLGSDPDIETRRACLISLRSLNDPNVGPLAAAALTTPELTSDALTCLNNTSHKHADAVIELARRDLRSDTLANAIMTLSRWGKSTKSQALTDKLSRAIAEIHGTHGSLVRWQAVGPLADDERLKAIERFVAKDAIAEHPKLKKDFDFRIGRVELARNDDPKTPVWIAYTDVMVAAPTNVEFFGSSGGSFEVFLNGKSIHRRAKPGKFQLDSDRFAATLDKGVNRVLVQTGESFVVEFDLHFRRKSSKADHEKLTHAALSRTGNIERGRKLLLDKDKSLCLKCHQVGDLGEKIGPDLTGVGGRFSRIHIVESILEPSRTIAPSYGTFAASLKNGKTINGIKVAETELALTLADNQGVKHTLPKGDIDEVIASPVSSMPDGLEKRFTEDEFVDLLAFLMSQKAAR